MFEKGFHFSDFVGPNPAEPILSGAVDKPAAVSPGGETPGPADTAKRGTASVEAVFACAAARRKEEPFDFDAAMSETAARLNAAAPPGAVEWAAVNRPDLMANVDKAAALLDEAAADNDAVVFNLALGDYEAAWRAVFEAYEKAAEAGRPHQDGQALGADTAGAGESFPCPGDTGGGYKDGGIDKANKSRQTSPGDMPVQTERPESAAPTPVQPLLFPEAGAGGETPGRPAPPRLPFDPEPAPVVWQEWLDRVKIVTVEDLDTWRSALAAAKAAGVCGFDTETTGLDPFVNEIRLLQLAVPAYPAGKKNLVAEDGRGPEPGGGAVAYVADLWRFGEEDRREMLEGVAGLVADPSVSFAGHNLKFDLKFLRSALAAAEGRPRWPGKRFACERLFDTMLASQLVTAGDFIPEAQFPKWREEHGVHIVKEGNGPTRYYDRHGHEIKFERDTQKKIRPVYPTHSLKEVAHRHLEVVLDKEEQASDWSAPELTERQIRYAGLDAAVLLPLREIMEKLLRKNRLARAAKIEFDCLPAAVEIECAGMPFDTKRAWEMETAVKAAAESARLGLVELARGAGFRARPKKNEGKRYSPDLNPDSPVDVVDCLEILAGREGVLAGEGGKGFQLPGGEILPMESRDDTLTRVAAALPEGSKLRQFIEMLQKYRGQKKKSDFLKKWIELTHPATGRLHPDLRQLNPQGVGRFSASNPNVQQAGRDKEIRALFRVIEGRKLVLADYSAIEMRIAAQLTRDENLLKAFNEGIDIHKYTAAFISGKDISEVSKAERQMGKPLNFGLIYGMHAATLKDYSELGYGVKISIEEAEAAREKFFEAYPGIARWHADQDRRGYEGGFEVYFCHNALRGYFAEKRPCVRTLSSRMRVWPVVTQTSRNGRTYARKAGSFTELYNTPDQGSGADIIKLAMSLIYRELCQRGWDDIFLVLCVHDELHLEAPEARAEEALELLKSAMIKGSAEILPSVPVEIEAAVGDSWSDKA